MTQRRTSSHPLCRSLASAIDVPLEIAERGGTHALAALKQAAVQDYIDGRANNPGDYNMLGRNCAEFVGDALKAGGLDVPGPHYDPLDYFGRLDRTYGSP